MTTLKTIFLGATILFIGLCVNPARAATASCDRACLLEMGDEYLNALTFKDKQQLARVISPTVRITENGEPTGLGEGLVWTTALGFPVRQSFCDPVTGNFVVFAVSRDANNQRAQVGIRLRVEDRKITEIESVIIRKGDHSLFEGGEPPAMLPLWSTPVPGSSKLSREQLIHSANEYYETLVRGDPKGLFHPDCDRVENGMQTSNNPAARGGISCTEGGKGYYAFIKGARGRRFVVVDEELGVVVAEAHLDLPGTVKTLNVRGKVIELPERNMVQRSSFVMAAYKIEYGHIKSIMARVREEAYLYSTVWDR